MNFRTLVIALISFIALPASAVEDLDFSYTYKGNHGVDFSSMPKGPLRLATFTDARSVDSPALITDEELGNSSATGGYQLDRPVADLVRDALVQGFVSGNAALVDSGEKLLIVGELLASDARLTTSNDVETIQITLRTNIKLQGSGGTIWETILFARGKAPASEGLESALTDALNRIVRELLRDDYFLIEVT